VAKSGRDQASKGRQAGRSSTSILVSGQDSRLPFDLRIEGENFRFGILQNWSQQDDLTKKGDRRAVLNSAARQLVRPCGQRPSETVGRHYSKLERWRARGQPPSSNPELKGAAT